MTSCARVDSPLHAFMRGSITNPGSSCSKPDLANPGILQINFNCYLRWPTTVTSKPNAYSKLQIAHIKFKSLTANSSRSQQIQIAHSELQITHSNLQIAHSKLKSTTTNSNRLQQIKVAHSKFKLLATNYKSLTPLGVFDHLQPAVQLV